MRRIEHVQLQLKSIRLRARSASKLAAGHFNLQFQQLAVFLVPFGEIFSSFAIHSSRERNWACMGAFKFVEPADELGNSRRRRIAGR